MVFTLTLPTEFPYVLAVATSAFFVNSYHAILTGGARRKSGLKYPISYATEEQAAKDPAAATFNCAQRAHSNFTENLTPLVGEMLIAGLQFPVISASIGGAWVFARIMYARGYVKNGPQGRMRWSTLHFVSDLALKLLAAYTSVTFVMSTM